MKIDKKIELFIVNKIIPIILILFLIVIINKILDNDNNNSEGFLIFNQDNAPWFAPSPSTRNMSLDLRCDPYIEKDNSLYKKIKILSLPRYKCLEMHDYLSS